MVVSASKKNIYMRGYADGFKDGATTAAPDLLACVKDAHAMLRTVEVIDGESGDPWSKAIARIEAVIAKASA